MAAEFFQCAKCFKMFSTRGKFNQHLKTHSKPFTCEVCQRGFGLRLDLNRHIKSRHRTGQQNILCHVSGCPFKTTRKDNLIRHLRRRHGAISQELRPEDSSSEVNNGDSPWLHPISHSSPKLEFTEQLYNCSMFRQAASSGNTTLLEACLETGIALEAKANDGSTALHCAARAGQTATVQYLLEKGAYAQAVNESRRIPLHEAILSQNPDTVKVLLHNTVITGYQQSIENHLLRTESVESLQLYIEHAKNTFANRDDQNMLVIASKLGKITMVAALLHYSVIDVNGKNPAGNAPIHQAARYGHIEVMSLLLASKEIDLNIETRVGKFNPLHIAASKGHHDIVELLLSHETIMVNSVDRYKRTALHLAAAHNHDEVLKILIRQDGININSKDRAQQTPLHLAATRNQAKAGKILISEDTIDINSKNRKGQAPLHLAAKYGSSEVIKILLDSNHFDTGCLDRIGQSPLHLAAFNGHWEALNILLGHWEQTNNHANTPKQTTVHKDIDRTGVISRLLAHPDFQEVNLADRWSSYEDTLLHKAATNGDCDITRGLLAHKEIDVNLVNRMGKSPLMAAAEQGNVDAGGLLLEHKDIDIAFCCSVGYSRGFNALQIARRNCYKEFADLLLSHGAKDDQVNASITVRQENNVSRPTWLAQVLNDAPPEPELEVQSYSFMDEYMDDYPMDFDMSDTEDVDMAA